MKKILILISLLAIHSTVFSQKLLVSWSQQNIENYTKEMYDDAQKLSSKQLLEKNLKDQYWSEVFLTLNASINNYSKDKEFLKLLTEQLTDKTETKLKGTSRLVIWDRISTRDIIFEGKGLVIENDLFTVAGRANQILQNLSKKNFGYVTINSSKNDLENLKNKWQDYLIDKPVEEFKPAEFKNSKISEISGLPAVKALIISLQASPEKEKITKDCLKKIYKLDEMPKEKGSHSFCDPNTYTFAYLGMLFGDEKPDETKDATWWLDFWNKNEKKLNWNSDKGIYEVKK